MKNKPWILELWNDGETDYPDFSSFERGENRFLRRSLKSSFQAIKY